MKLPERNDKERGNITLPLIILTVAFLLIVGLVVDGAGKEQAGEHASQVAQSAARVAANSINGNVVTDGTIQLNPTAAQNAANAYLAAAGVTGTSTVAGDTVTVTTTQNYTTIFLSIIGINTLTGHGTASAKLIDR